VVFHLSCPLRSDVDAIFFKAGEKEFGVIGNLVSFTDTHWTIDQHNSPKTFAPSLDPADNRTAARVTSPAAFVLVHENVTASI
jgi:hypothetical protein